MADWGNELVAKGQGSERDLTEAAVAVREQRLAFLQTIKAQIPDGVIGGDGITEVLLERRESDRAKLVSVTRALLQKNLAVE
ncbi:hypothetical protein G6M04_30325 [Agrobacterium rhizogenes]|uniref:hypothetical protein n=1 Tax=Rhizobium rhizogenes TaxID=359 RepID=UPI001572E800|nr:hypothetical protein [Rhizobium rhizogenes]NTG51695.1 hypothetical protein [Rhizobium rhizogenes]